MKELKHKLTPRKFALVARAMLTLFLSAGVVAVARAQDENPPDATPRAQREAGARRRNENAAGLLRVLNLTPEQRAQISAIRRETEPQGRLLGARLREARRALDEAIYAADPDEGIIEERVRGLGAAQTAVVRLRSLTELRIRRVLSPEQLDAFRRLQRAAERRTRARRRLNQLPRRRDDLPGDAPTPTENNMRQRQERQQRQRLPDGRNTPPSAAPSERPPAPSRAN
jgi:Spy/CpxP family protein refolding chaperone